MNHPTHQNLAEQVTRARELIHEGLRRFSRLDPADCKESFLLQNDRFQGIRFKLGMFEARWTTGETKVVFFRDGTEIATREFESENISKAA